MVGQTLRIAVRLGSGGMGIVYRRTTRNWTIATSNSRHISDEIWLIEPAKRD